MKQNKRQYYSQELLYLKNILKGNALDVQIGYELNSRIAKYVLFAHPNEAHFLYCFYFSIDGILYNLPNGLEAGDFHIESFDGILKVFIDCYTIFEWDRNQVQNYVKDLLIFSARDRINTETRCLSDAYIKLGINDPLIKEFFKERGCYLSQ